MQSAVTPRDTHPEKPGTNGVNEHDILYWYIKKKHKVVFYLLLGGGGA